MLWNAEFDQNYEKTLSQKFFFYKLSADVARDQNHRMINLREGEKPKNVRQFSGKTSSNLHLLNID